MTLDVEKNIWNIYNQVMQREEYAVIVENFRKSTDELQTLAQSFSKEQWDAFIHYRDAFMDLHETMMAIALEHK